MTAVRDRKTRLCFETDERFRGREIVIEVEPRLAYVRLKGTRTRYPISWEGIFNKAVQLEAARVRAEKLAKKKAGR